MKKIILICSILLSINVHAQAPEGVNYQAVIRDLSGTIIANTPIGLRLSIRQTVATGTIVYSESFTPYSNDFGLVNVVLGQGTVISGSFPSINWASGPYFIEIAADVTGGTSYATLGTQQLMSVPYALHAKTADNQFSGDYNDLTNQPTIPTALSQLTNDAGFITSPNDADADPTNEIQNLSISGTNLTLSSGNTVSLAGVNPPLTEAQVDAYVANNGYLTSEVDGSVTNELQSLSISGTNLTLSSGNTVSLAGVNPPLTEAQVDAFVANNGYLTSEVDGSTTNELQTLSTVGTTITLSNGGGTINVPRPVQNDNGTRANICSGNSTSGTGWVAYNGTTISLSVNTSGCAFTSTPRYFTSMGGLGSHFELVGYSAIYSPSATGFTVYVQRNNGAALVPADAVTGGWFVNWTAIGN